MGTMVNIVASHTSAVIFLIWHLKFQIRNIKYQMLKCATQRLLNSNTMAGNK